MPPSSSSRMPQAKTSRHSPSSVWATRGWSRPHRQPPKNSSSRAPASWALSPPRRLVAASGSCPAACWLAPSPTPWSLALPSAAFLSDLARKPTNTPTSNPGPSMCSAPSLADRLGSSGVNPASANAGRSSASATTARLRRRPRRQPRHRPRLCRPARRPRAPASAAGRGAPRRTPGR